MIVLRRPKRKVRVHFTNLTESIDGVLLGRIAGHYVLRAASLVHQTGSQHELAGEIHIPVANVSFLQHL